MDTVIIGDREYNFPLDHLNLSPLLKNHVGNQELLDLEIQPEIVNLMIRWCTNYLENPRLATKYDEDPLDHAFFLELSTSELLGLTMGSYDLKIQPLMDAVCLFIARKLIKMTPEDIREEFNITKEFTPAEEEKARLEFDEMIRDQRNEPNK
ncbi:Skp1 family protein [uncultured virus]|nr:Skp1 family protein [uncultured virus]